MSNNKKYWQSLEQLNGDPKFLKEAQNEFSEEIPVDEFLGKEELKDSSTSRRDFLKFLGFSVSAAALAACETPVTKTIPYVVKPEEITPGVENWYASTFSNGVDFCNILVKAREGRPIHIQGNDHQASLTKGGMHPRVNSSVLSLYDSSRLKHPLIEGQKADWKDVDLEIKGKLGVIANNGGKIRILSNSINSPSTNEVIKDFKQKYGGEDAADIKHVSYDAVSYYGMIKANEETFGKAVIPDYKFENAKTIVGIGADFLCNWLSALEYSNGYTKRRNPDGEWMNRHYQFESIMSLTGSNADIRGAVKPSEQGIVALHLYNQVAKKAGQSTLPAGEIKDDNKVMSKIEAAAEDLWNNRGASLVVAGSNDTDIQKVVNGINHLLGNYGKTVDLNAPLFLKNGNDEQVADLVNEMNQGGVDALIVYGCNPIYSMPAEWKFKEAMEKVKLKISLDYNETAKHCNYVCPDSHYLESWNDHNPKMGYYSLTQPLIRPLFNTRQAQDSLLAWAGNETGYYDYIRGIWEKYGFPHSKENSFEAYWNKSVHDGVVYVPEYGTGENESEITFDADLNAAANKLKNSKGGDWELQIYMENSMGDGQQANNAWLQEIPHTVTKVTWDNYITMNPADMKGKFNTGIQQEDPADVARIIVNGMEMLLPVIPMPGQKIGTVGIALGYGRTEAGKVGNGVGKNIYPAVSIKNGTLNYAVENIQIESAGETYPIAMLQTHPTEMGRRIVQETTLDVYKKGDKEVYNPPVLFKDAYGVPKPPEEANLWEDHAIDKGHRWGMSIDLNACTGCNACVTACISENNVPVVGKDEVRRNRDMLWLRIDRYFSSDADPKEEGDEKDYSAMENPSAYPEVVYQPMLCQHCNHAPCETVCPVAATTHSNEGLNQMIYNRCVGTRYCANNCPYKVRRFNWFQYDKYKKFDAINPAQDQYERMVLNPDVVVRSRGVMEKCTFCVQRIQAGKLQAKKQNRKVKDGDIKTACSAACQVGAIKFGDVNDDTEVRKEAKQDRAYNLLAEVGTQPNIWYQTKVRNKPMSSGNEKETA